MLKNTVKSYVSEGSVINQVIMSILMVFPIFSYGTAVGWLSPMAPHLMSEAGPSSEPLHPDVVSWMASVPYLVGTVAVFLFGYIVDYHGRKRALMLSSLFMAICWSLKLYSSQPWALILARSFIGFGIGGSYVVTTLYIKEISEDSMRGTLGTLAILSQNLGNLFVYLIGEYLTYYAVLWMCLAVPLAHILVFTTMPESPSYLLKCGKVEEARDALAWLRCRRTCEDAVDEELKKCLQELENTRVGLLEALKTIARDRATSRAFRITFVITLARELCGCLAVLHFASLIFEKAGGDFVMTANQQAIVLGAVQMLGSCTASGLVERTGRKILLASTCFVAGLAMLVLGTWFYLAGAGSNPALGWLPITSLCLCIYCDAAGLQPVPFVIMTEIFPFHLRGSITSLVMALACTLVSVQLRVFHPIASSLGMHAIFWIFSSVCVVSTVYIALCVPETKMRSLADIYEELGGKKKTKDVEDNVTRL